MCLMILEPLMYPNLLTNDFDIFSNTFFLDELDLLKKKMQAFKVRTQYESENIMAFKGREGHRKMHCFDSELEGTCEFKYSCTAICKSQCYSRDLFKL